MRGFYLPKERWRSAQSMGYRATAGSLLDEFDRLAADTVGRMDALDAAADVPAPPQLLFAFGFLMVHDSPRSRPTIADRGPLPFSPRPGGARGNRYPPLVKDLPSLRRTCSLA